jgi:hypothetical protein
LGWSAKAAQGAGFHPAVMQSPRRFRLAHRKPARGKGFGSEAPPVLRFMGLTALLKTNYNRAIKPEIFIKIAKKIKKYFLTIKKK